MLSTVSKWLLFVFACIVCFISTPTLAEESLSPTIFHRLAEKVFGKQVAFTVDIPDCLVELKGGINGVEDTLKEGIEDGKKWAILVTTSGDKTSIAAIERFYKAVDIACNPAPKSIDTTETENPIGTFDDDTSDQEYVDEVASFDFSEWKFAYMSFIGEPKLIWRWWIWKVPSIVFVSAPTQDQIAFDMRFWKIAFSMPTSKEFLEAIGTGGWMNLGVWESSLAPGGSLEMIPHGLGKAFGLTYHFLDPIPTWLLTILASILGTSLITMLHKGEA